MWGILIDCTTQPLRHFGRLNFVFPLYVASEIDVSFKISQFFLTAHVQTRALHFQLSQLRLYDSFNFFAFLMSILALSMGEIVWLAILSYNISTTSAQNFLKLASNCKKSFSVTFKSYLIYKAVLTKKDRACLNKISQRKLKSNLIQIFQKKFSYFEFFLSTLKKDSEV